MSSDLPTLDNVCNATARIERFAVLTPVLCNPALDDAVGARLLFKCENLQRGGAFKFRGACNAVWALSDVAAAHGVVTHSSGNHGIALALAAASRGITAHVVVPEGAVRAKLDAIRAAGATVHRCASTQAAREDEAARVARETGAHLVHPYADAMVMAGQGTVLAELLRQAGELDAFITPVGGGGLAAGCAVAARAAHKPLRQFLAEPQGAADTALSLARGERVTDIEPRTVCDGLRAIIGEPNFRVLRAAEAGVLTVSDAEIIAAMRQLWQHLKVVVEPSSAIVMAALLRYRDYFSGMRVGVVLTGGNVDLDALPW